MLNYFMLTFQERKSFINHHTVVFHSAIILWWQSLWFSSC